MGDQVPERELFLQKNYHLLVKCIQPSSFYSWLRHKKVLSEDEQEDIEARYQIRSLRAGRLVDVIMRKGENGYNAFMECVEYLYPDLYTDMTEKQPRTPPSAFQGTPGSGRSFRRKDSSKTKSSEVMLMMMNIMQKLTIEVIDKKTKLQELQQLFRGVEEERESEESEMSFLYDEIDILRNKNDEYKSENEKLAKKLQGVMTERDATQSRCKEMQVKRDEFMEQCEQMREKLEKMGCKMEELNGAVRKERSMSCRRDQLEKLKEENQELKKKLDVQMSQDVAANKPLLAEVAKLRSQIAELEKKVEALMVENTNLTDQCRCLEDRCSLLQENNNERQTDIKQVTAERDQYQKLYAESEKRLAESLQQNEEISKQCHTYLDRICLLAERTKCLEDEIDALKSENPLPAKVRVKRTPDVSNIDASCYPLFGISSPHSPPLRKFSNDSTHSQKVEDIGGRRMASYEALGLNDPLVVFAPKEIESLLFEHLEKHFSVCPFDTCQTDSAEGAKVKDNPDVLVFKKSPFSYSLIQKSQLRQHKQVLLSIPVHCVRQMKEKLKVNPVIVIVKYKSKDTIPEYTVEEETLTKTEPISYNVITVNENLKSNFTRSDALTIIDELKRIVDRENAIRRES